MKKDISAGIVVFCFFPMFVATGASTLAAFLSVAIPTLVVMFIAICIHISARFENESGTNL